MSSYREQGLLHKKIQIGIVDARPVAPKAKKVRTISLELYETWGGLKKAPRWIKWSTYRKTDEAHTAAKQLLRKYTSWFDITKYRIDGVAYAVDI